MTIPVEASMDLLSIFLPIIFVNMMGWLTPGPNMLAVISESITNGRLNGIITGLGLALGATLWALLAVVGIEAIFAIFPFLTKLLRILGAGYLLWIGFNLITKSLTADNVDLSILSPEPSKTKAFSRGFLVCVTNPKAAFFFGSILTAFVPVEASATLLGCIVLLCSFLAIIFHSITATIFSSRAVVRKFNSSKQKISATFGALFIGTGIGVAYNTIQNR